MLNKQLPILEKKEYPDSIKLKDGDIFTGIMTKGEVVETQYGKAYKFTFTVEGVVKTIITSSEFLAGKLNQSEEGWTVTIKRVGIGKNTKWDVRFIQPKEIHENQK